MDEPEGKVAGPGAPMRPRFRWKIVPITIACFVGAVILLAPIAREDGMDCCVQCGTYRDREGWVYGIGGFHPWLRLVPRDSVRPSRALADMFPPDHEHEWQQSHYHYGHGGWTCGGRYRNGFAVAYEESESLREFLLAGIRNGEMAREEVLGMLRLSRRPWNDTPSEKALRARAWSLMKSHAPGFHEFGMDGSRYEVAR